RPRSRYVVGDTRTDLRSAYRPVSGSRPFRGGSVGVGRGVEQGHFGRAGSLEDEEPSVEIGAPDRVSVPRWLRVPRVDAPPELVGRHVQVVQLDADPEVACGGAHLVPFGPGPEPEIEDDAHAEAQDLPGQAPQLTLDLLARGLVPGTGAEGRQPLVLGEPHRAPVR